MGSILVGFWASIIIFIISLPCIGILNFVFTDLFGPKTAYIITGLLLKGLFSILVFYPPFIILAVIALKIRKYRVLHAN